MIYLDDDYNDELDRKLGLDNWREHRATKKQIALLRRLKYPGPMPETKGEASALITKILEEKK